MTSEEAQTGGEDINKWSRSTPSLPLSPRKTAQTPFAVSTSAMGLKNGQLSISPRESRNAPGSLEEPRQGSLEFCRFQFLVLRSATEVSFTMFVTSIVTCILQKFVKDAAPGWGCNRLRLFRQGSGSLLLCASISFL